MAYAPTLAKELDKVKAENTQLRRALIERHCPLEAFSWDNCRGNCPSVSNCWREYFEQQDALVYQ